MERAKELFYKYRGNHFYMDHDGAGWEYDSYHVSRETEEKWTEELVSHFLASELRGREALRIYSAVTDLMKSDRSRADWDVCLYYPLRASHLDDVTILFMLPDSFRMAEKAVKQDRFSKEEAGAYLGEMDSYIRELQERAEEGTMTRADDYVLKEFSDPVYVADYLSRLKKKWEGLFY